MIIQINSEAEVQSQWACRMGAINCTFCGLPGPLCHARQPLVCPLVRLGAFSWCSGLLLSGEPPGTDKLLEHSQTPDTWLGSGGRDRSRWEKECRVKEAGPVDERAFETGLKKAVRRGRGLALIAFTWQQCLVWTNDLPLLSSALTLVLARLC